MNAPAPILPSGLLFRTFLSESPAGIFDQLCLTLAIDTIAERATGGGEVRQMPGRRVECLSMVTGTLIYEFVMKPGQSHIRIDLVGHAGVCNPGEPVLPPNLKATLVVLPDFSRGTARFSWADGDGRWRSQEQPVFGYAQPIGAA